MASQAVFLDRDGVLVEEVGYLRRIEDLRLVPGAVQALREINRHGLLSVVITNQSAVGRGLLTEEELHRVHEHMLQRFEEAGAHIDAIYYCPHHPQYGEIRDCECRKPGIGMLLRAAEEHGIRLEESFLIGDQLTDIEAGNRAGCSTVLVKTGYGETALDSLASASENGSRRPDFIARTVLEGVGWIFRAG